MMVPKDEFPVPKDEFQYQLVDYVEFVLNPTQVRLKQPREREGRRFARSTH